MERVRRFNPGMPIPPEATAVHGITDADIADEAPFCQRARALLDHLADCDLAGFNIRRFDVQMLIAEFQRCGMDFDLDGPSRHRRAEHLPPRGATGPLGSGPLLSGPRARGGPYRPGRHPHLGGGARRPAPALRPSCRRTWTASTPTARATPPSSPRWTAGSGPPRRAASSGAASTRAALWTKWPAPSPTISTGCSAPTTCPRRCCASCATRSEAAQAPADSHRLRPDIHLKDPRPMTAQHPRAPQPVAGGDPGPARADCRPWRRPPSAPRT